MSDARRPNETDNDFLARLIFGEDKVKQIKAEK